MAGSTESNRSHSYGEGYSLTPVDRFGVWLSSRRIRRAVGTFAGKRVGDFGCGYDASMAKTLLDEVERMVLIDVSLNPRLTALPKVTAIEGVLPDAMFELPAAGLDVVICNSVLEHLTDPQRALDEFWRLLRAGGVCLVNVPSWRGKFWLELSAFRLGLSPKTEIDDHKMYFDPRELWPMLIRAGFRPSGVHLFRHKLGLNTFAICQKA